MEVDSGDRSASMDSIDVFHSMDKINVDGADVDDENMKLVLSDDDDVMEDDEDYERSLSFIEGQNITVNEERTREGREQVVKNACVEIREAFAACHVRGLVHASKWLMDLYDSIKPSQDGSESDVKFEEHLDDEPVEIFDPEDDEFMSTMLGRTYLMSGEYARAAHATEDCTGQVGLFMHFYARYFQLEKNKVDNTADPLDLKPAPPDPDLLDLKAKLKACVDAGHVDGFLLYLMGIISKKLDLKDEAIDYLADSVRLYPMNWSAWWELAALSCHRTILWKVSLSDHWMRFFFLAHAYFELQLNDAAMDFCRTLLKCGFNKSLFVWTLIAVGHHNKRESDSSIDVFKMIRRLDPYRLEMMDVLSNLLYVRDEKEELAQLAREASAVDRYRVETCCIVGNHHSLQNRHEKSVLCFQRALRLNPSYLPAWTLLGHEYMELRNTPAAIQAYRNAIEVNPRDYRAWYGLGQTYDNIKLHNYAVFYYRCAQGLRPYDYRMYVALGFVFENMGRYQAALTCYSKAQKVGDAENVSFIRFGKVYERMKQPHKAAACYKKYIEKAADTGGSATDYFAAAYKHMVDYSLEYNKLEKAREYVDILLKTYYKRKDGREDASVKVLLKKVEEKEAVARGENLPEAGSGGTEEKDGGQTTAEPATEAVSSGVSGQDSVPADNVSDQSLEYSITTSDFS